MEAESRNGRRLVAIGALLWVCFFLLYLLTARARLYAGDDMFYLNLARNWLKYGTVQFGFSAEELAISKYSLGQVLLNLPIAPALDVVMSDGASWRAFLLAMLVIGGWQAGLGACQIVLMWRVAVLAGLRERIALATALLYGVGTMVWPGAQRAYADQSLALLLLVVFWGMLRFGRSRRWGDLLMAGGASGFALLVKPTSVLFAMVLTLAVGGMLLMQERGEWRGILRRRLELAAWIVPHLLGVAGVMGYNFWRYGALLESGYNSSYDAAFGFNTPLLTGLFSMLLSSGKGVLWYNPILILGFWGMGRWWRSWRLGLLAMLGCLGSTLALHAPFWAWHGDWYWGPRYLMPVLPLWFLSVGFALERLAGLAGEWQRRLAAGIVALLTALSIGVQLIGTFSINNEYFRFTAEELVPLIFAQEQWKSPAGPVTNPALLMHYVPDFSPLRVQAWMIRVMAAPEGKWQEVYRRPPWRNHTPEWIPEPPRAKPFTFQPWWLFTLTQPVPEKGWPTALAIALAIGLAVGGWQLRRTVGLNRAEKG